MIRFYTPDIAERNTLSETESGHCCRVLRMKEGDRFFSVDGKGTVYECEITSAHPKHTEFRIIDSHEEPAHWSERIVIAVAPTKNIDRIEWLLEKVVEIGVNEIVLLKCAHSERKNVNEERLEKIIVSAMKQSLKSAMPLFRGLVPFADFIKGTETDCRFVGYCDKNIERREFASEYPGKKDVTILIGPEGDFSPEEIGLAMDNGFVPVTFGDSRLRTETAALFAVTAVHVVDQIKK